MGLYLFEKQIIDKAQKDLKPGQKITVRRQQCAKWINLHEQCGVVLAFSIGSELDKQDSLEYYIIRGANSVKGELVFLYEKRRWFGNHVKCPRCGNEGKLPMDKPLNWDLMQQRDKITKEGLNANRN